MTDRPFQVASTFDRHMLRRLAGATSFGRGEAYFVSGRVRSLDEHRGAVVAEVEGSATYAVKLWAEGKELGYSCSCPRGDDGACCKHCVAVGLAVLAGQRRPATPHRRKPRLTLDDVREYLAREDKTVLVDLLVKRAAWDDALRDQLFLKTATKRRRGGVDVEAMKQALDRAIDRGDYVSWREVRDYANGVDEAVKAVEAVLEEGQAAEAIELAEHALEATEAAVASVDDSDGQMGSILERLQALHHRACQKARPDPVQLATRLFAWEMDSDYGVFSGAVVVYADVLGTKGVAAYRERAEDRWKTVPALAPGQDDPERYGSRFRISSIMSALSRMDADVEAQVGVLKRDLSHAYNFLTIAETYREAGRNDLALEWAEMGLRAFPERTDSRLRGFVADEYHRRGRHTDATDLAWTEFRERPDLERYKNLRRHANRAKSWSTWRERALAAVRQEVATQTREHGRSQRVGHADRSLLVEIYLWESDLEAAWKEAQTGGCSEGLWLVLADERGKEYPEDALPIYQRHVELTLRHAHNDAYADAVKLLKRVGQLMADMGRQQDFALYLESVRATHTRKRNFTRLLSRANWTRATT